MTSESIVLLDKRESRRYRNAEIGSDTLSGTLISEIGSPESPGVADSMDVIVSKELIAVPTYQLIVGRAFADKENAAWQESYDTLAERITAYDDLGIMGEKGAVYAMDIQNGGMFVWNSGRIRDAATSGNLVNQTLKLEQNEVNQVLDAIKRQDHHALKELVHGGNVVFSGNYDGFIEASAAPNFLDGMTSTYVVLRPAKNAKKLRSHARIEAQKRNPDIVIASGGIENAERMLNKFVFLYSGTNFSAWHDSYKHHNTGRVLKLIGLPNGGVDGNTKLGYFSNIVGVAPEALRIFYKKCA